MILGLFDRERKHANRRVVLALYEALTAAARQPALYRHMGVPDTVMGRFEAIAAHVILFMRRSSKGSEAVRAVGQEIVDAFFLEVDHSIRELGIGDVSVPKNMKKFARMFYGRADSYARALDSNDESALGQALGRNLYPSGEGQAREMAALAAYLSAVDASLAGARDADILCGRIALAEAVPPAPPVASA